MMFYAGTDSWIYILFGILWVAFAIYKGSKRAVVAEKTEKDTLSSTSSGLESIMGTFLSDKDVAEEIPESPKDKEEELVKPVVESEKPVNFEKEIHTSAIKEEPAETLSHPHARKINMKKAIIYSEILRRPYE